MKKTLAALSVLGAFAGSSLAADVTLYGVIDTGLVYQHADADLPDVDTVDTFQMKVRRDRRFPIWPEGYGRPRQWA